MERVLTSDQLNSIIIKDFVFHIIRKDFEEPLYLDEVVFSTEENNIIKDWLKDSKLKLVEFEYNSVETPINGLFDSIALSSGASFTELSKIIASQFLSYHKRSSSDGVLILSNLIIEEDKNLFLILKTNREDVLEYEIIEENQSKRAILKKVTNPLVDFKSVFQKIAFIDLENNFSWDVLAQDKQKQTFGIAEYFENFLNVRVREVASVLTRKVVNTVYKWARDAEEDLSEGLTPIDYKTKAKEYLETHNEFDTQGLISMVVYENDDTKRAQQMDSLLLYLEENDIAGRAFEPKPNSLSRKETNNRIKTAQGVVITWDGSRESKNIEIDEKEDGRKEIKILTSRIDYK